MENNDMIINLISDVATTRARHNVARILVDVADALLDEYILEGLIMDLNSLKGKFKKDKVKKVK
jgi:hypothetical protein